jgi:acyl-CoA dehydrogenase
VSGETTLPADPVTALGALVRATAIAGALETVSSLVTAHAGTREQFGRPLDRFQAVQAHLVTVASETASAGMAAEFGRRGLDGDLDFAVAVAKTRAAVAATAAARAAHQVLGAVGTTELHALGHHTRRLWSWRDEHGSQVWWQRKVGNQVATAGGTGLWELMTGATR